MAKTGLFATFEEGFYDAWAPERPKLDSWRSDKQPGVMFQVLWAGREVRYMVDEVVLVQTRGLYEVGYAIGKATKRAFYPPGGADAG